jgi:hypothetical protein
VNVLDTLLPEEIDSFVTIETHEDVTESGKSDVESPGQKGRRRKPRGTRPRPRPVRTGKDMCRICFDWVSVFLPKRIVKEDVGDALERIAEWRERHQGNWLRAMIVLKIVSTLFFLTINTVREIASALWGGKKAN